MSSPPCQAQIASLSERYTALRSAVERAAEALQALGTVPGPSEARSQDCVAEDRLAEDFLAADRRVTVIAREIAAMLDR